MKTEEEGWDGIFLVQHTTAQRLFFSASKSHGMGVFGVLVPSYFVPITLAFLPALTLACLR